MEADSCLTVVLEFQLGEVFCHRRAIDVVLGAEDGTGVGELLEGGFAAVDEEAGADHYLSFLADEH